VLTTIPLDQIDPPRVDLRASIDDERIRELARSIREVGLLQPIGVVANGDRYQIVFGNGRYLAHRYLGSREIECRVLTTEEAGRLAASVAENVVRRDLSPVEEARALRTMIDVQGKTVREAAGVVGRSEAWVRQRLDILLWPEDIILAVAHDELSPAVARELVLVEDETMRGVYFRAAVENGVTAVQMRMWRAEWDAQRACQVASSDATLVPPLPPSPVMPKALCNLCKYDYPITMLTFTRLCGSCASEITAAGRVPLGGGGGAGPG
jgi:ParB family transcriptional regulator, chromosome partitioning protein